jgi:hypothetical protein
MPRASSDIDDVAWRTITARGKEPSGRVTLEQLERFAEAARHAGAGPNDHTNLGSVSINLQVAPGERIR